PSILFGASIKRHQSGDVNNMEDFDNFAPLAASESTEAEGCSNLQSYRSGWPRSWLSSIASRYAFFTLTGHLDKEEETVKSLLAKSGAVGKQLQDRMCHLESEGWTFGVLNPNDSWLRAQYPNPFLRFCNWMNLAGYNSDITRRITYGSPMSTL